MGELLYISFRGLKNYHCIYTTLHHLTLNMTGGLFCWNWWQLNSFIIWREIITWLHLRNCSSLLSCCCIPGHWSRAIRRRVSIPNCRTLIVLYRKDPHVFGDLSTTCVEMAEKYLFMCLFYQPEICYQQLQTVALPAIATQSIGDLYSIECHMTLYLPIFELGGIKSINKLGISWWEAA